MNTNAAGGFPHVILASASPRRLDLLRQAGIEPEVEPSHVVEVIRSTKPDEVVMELSRQKAEDIASRHTGEDVVVIGADTVVAFDGNILGKAKGRGGCGPHDRFISGQSAPGIHRRDPGVLWKSSRKRG